MSNLDCAIAKLLDPLSLPTFLEAYWEKEPLHLQRHAPDHYAGLFGLDEVEQYLFTVKPRGNELRLVAMGKPDIVFHEQEEAPPRVVFQAFREGYTLNLNGVHRRWPAVHALVDAVQRRLRCYANGNAYITGPTSQGFGTHHDGHDVFVLQTSGRKRWRLYAAQEEFPLEGRKMGTEDWGAPVREIELTAGDLLYLPRGTPHSAVTDDCCSVHLSIGVRPVLMDAVLAELVRAVVRKHPHWRRSVAPVGTRCMRQVPCIHELADQLSEDIRALGPLDPLLETLEAQLVQPDEVVGPGPGGYLRSLEGLGAIGSDSELETRPGHASVLSRNGDEVSLGFNGGALVAPAFCEPALRYVLEQSRFRIRDLPDTLTEDARVMLCRRLVREGLLRVADEAPAEDRRRPASPHRAPSSAA
ncbi:cupin domain-containing protein [Pyxidicoccus caerfyrddinensis]|uniref:cupin domain-containing protein n=1 Tax=Pyxidicoccus caerfyrddinensis TaxID=2709663 RepID=UPI0013DBED97|nr:cupin domain-containing protein [Pyxidicoccus caerfyrddinensis]